VAAAGLRYTGVGRGLNAPAGQELSIAAE